MGLKKNENDGPVCTFVKGGLTGFIEAIICYPTEFVKTQLQLQSKSNPEYTGMVDCAKQTVAKHGPTGLYRGALPLILGSSGKQAARWTGYETTANALKDEQGKLTIPKRMLAGACGGISEAIFAVTPIETLKTRVTDDMRRGTGNYSGSFDALVKILKNEGPAGLYMGLVPTIAKQATNQAVRFPVQFYAKQFLTGGDKSLDSNPIYNGVAGAFAGAVSVEMIDHFGITHFSCTVLNRIGRTNHYDSPHKICLNGQFYSWYFFDYIRKVYTALENNRKAKPLVSYMHFNTGHEMTGTRMINMDAGMAKFFTEMALFPDTLTVIFSDHGHKMTPFSYTEEGRRELFDPVFFMIVPDGVKEKLGPERMGALVTNQKRIFMLYDVHNAFTSLHDSQKKDSKNYSESGIFSEIPENRTCADLYMLPLTRCKCEGFDEAIPVKDNANDHIWLAEFAVGYINDAIQKQYMDGNDDSKSKYGYGNCQRLVGKSFEKVVKRFRGEYIVTTMDIHVVPPVGFTDDEVYRVSVRQFAKPTQGVVFLSSIRKTMYNKFASCADKSVDIKLCACAKEQTADASKKEVLFDNGIPRKMFGSDTIVRDLDSNCLLFLRRNYGTFSFALGVANVCTSVTYTFELTGSMDQRIFSKTLPIKRELLPKTFYFLTSVYKYISKVNEPLGLKVSVQVKKDGSDTFNNLGIFSVS